MGKTVRGLSNSMKLLIFDGNHLFHRIYHTTSGTNLATKSGMPSGVVHGFLSSVCSLIRMFEPDRVFVAWDRKSRYRTQLIETYRKKLPHDSVLFNSAPEFYKASRYKDRTNADHTRFQELLLPQMVDIQQMIPLMGITQFIVDGVEGDDLIGLTVDYFAQPDNDITIISSDRDLYQLLAPNVSLYDPIKKAKYTESHFRTEFRIDPYRYPEIKALTGDKNDDIPGVPGIGEKTAIELIAKCGDIQNLLEMSKHAPQTPKMSLLPDLEPQIKLAYELSFIMSSITELDTDQQDTYQVALYHTPIINWDELRNFAEVYELKKAWFDMKAVLPLITEEKALSKLKTLDELFTFWGECKRCPLHETRTHIVKWGGAESARIIICGEGPGAAEDFYGNPFVGRAGKFLDDECLAPNAMERKDLHIMNVVCCRPTDDDGNNRPPSPLEVISCRPRVQAQIRIVNPKIIVLVGDKAFKLFFPDLGKISQERGVGIKHPEWPNIVFVPVFHPSYLMRLSSRHSDVVKSKEDWRFIKSLAQLHDPATELDNIS